MYNYVLNLEVDSLGCKSDYFHLWGSWWQCICSVSWFQLCENGMTIQFQGECSTLLAIDKSENIQLINNTLQYPNRWLCKLSSVSCMSLHALTWIKVFIVTKTECLDLSSPKRDALIYYRGKFSLTASPVLGNVYWKLFDAFFQIEIKVNLALRFLLLFLFTCKRVVIFLLFERICPDKTVLGGSIG